MTTNPNTIPEPKVAGCARCDRIEAHALGIEGLLGRRRDQLAKAREEIGQLKARIDELEADKPEPGPWLTGDELEAVMPTLKDGDVVEVEHRLHGKFSGDLASFGDAALALAGWHIRNSAGNKMRWLDALRVIDRAPEPEPGAGIPDEVVEAACRASGVSNPDSVDCAHMRAALAAADAKRAELEEQA